MPSYGPNSPGTQGTLTLSGSTNSWSNTGNIASNDTSNATISLPSAGNYSPYLYGSNFGFSIGAGETIDGILVEWRYRCPNPNRMTDKSVRAVKGGAVAGSDYADLVSWWSSAFPSFPYISYGGASDLWGTTWADTDIEATDFGAALSCITVPSGTTASVDHVRITVYTSAGASGITGTASITEAADTLSAAGTVALAGTSSHTEGADAVSAASTLTLTGTSAHTEGADTLASAGAVALAGTSAHTEQPDTVAATGTVALAATSTHTEQPDSLASTGTIALAGVSSHTEGADTLTAAGALALAGTSTHTEAPDTLVATGGSGGVTGTASITEAADTLASTAVLRLAAELAATEAPDTLAGTATLALAGASAHTERPDTLSATGGAPGTGDDLLMIFFF